MRKSWRHAAVLTCLISGVPLLGGCMTAYRQQVGADAYDSHSRIFLTDFNTAWVSVQEALKAMRIAESKVEAGYVKTHWTENTAEKNFIETFGSAEAYLKAKFRFRVTVGKGFYNGKPSVKVLVQKDQLIQRDVLEGWQPVGTDSIDENTLLYRVSRLIYMKMKLAKMEEDRVKSEAENVKF